MEHSIDGDFEMSVTSKKRDLTHVDDVEERPGKMKTFVTSSMATKPTDLSVDAVNSSADEAGTSAAGNLDGAGTSGYNRVAASYADDQEDDEWLQSHHRTLCEMFPDADPEYLLLKCAEVEPCGARFEALVVELMDTKNYPKMQDYISRTKRMEMRKKFLDDMTVPEFLELFEDPEKVFNDHNKVMNLQYRHNSRAQLLNDLPYHYAKDVDRVLNANNYHYLPSLRELKSEYFDRRRIKRKETPISGELEDFFLKELYYARMEESIGRHRAAQEEAKKEVFAAAKDAGLLRTCTICCEDEILEEDMRACASLDSPHLFCKTCVGRYCEEQIGQGSLKFACCDSSCKEEFSLNVIKTVLKSSVFSNLLKRKQAEEIMAAGIADLECCPFCNFATIMPNKEDKIFHCLNPECLKDTCRLCKEPAHIPLRCEEIETKAQLSARTYLENQMTEAMVRECYKCGKRFIKEEGCNKMQCLCGAKMCYVCKKPITGYDHFDDGPYRATAGDLLPSQRSKCPKYSDSRKLHAEEVKRKAEEAKKTLDPDVQLKHDPTKYVPQGPATAVQMQRQPYPEHQYPPYERNVLFGYLEYLPPPLPAGAGRGPALPPAGAGRGPALPPAGAGRRPALPPAGAGRRPPLPAGAGRRPAPPAAPRGARP
ncbi:E3 ubiquitin-protein ligase RNF216 isoform X2 [Hyalella azteca]|uniref:E3 ubiquitin-protein ligase RNF216 isoform X2 n=1 Tax=Hyalella azteca TaxID=294128 RepID=A0A8B7PLQ6_HYAAZ|nr:E3 ubiquitin-protein ligase RNF216 isoform X2 [Hyalella azteca]